MNPLSLKLNEILTGNIKALSSSFLIGYPLIIRSDQLLAGLRDYLPSLCLDNVQPTIKMLEIFTEYLSTYARTTIQYLSKITDYHMYTSFYL